MKRWPIEWEKKIVRQKELELKSLENSQSVPIAKHEKECSKEQTFDKEETFDKEISMTVTHRLNQPLQQENCQFEQKRKEMRQNNGRLSDSPWTVSEAIQL